MPNFSGIWTVTQQMQAKGQSIWPAKPNAPTIGTATATGSTTATVAFTAPANDGYSTITSYTATSSPSGITGTLSQAGSGTITVSGLTASTSYTFTVTATNILGTSAASSASNSITTQEAPPTVIGQAYGGGFYAGQIGVSGVATHYLVVGPASSAQLTSVLYKNARSATPGAESDINGPQNTADMVADGNATVYPAAHFCNDLVTGGYSDWYMPAFNELEVCYYNLKPEVTINNTSSGINPNAVPARSSNYTTIDPPRTSSLAFRAAGAQAFINQGYWCSTEYTPDTARARYQNFNTGSQLYRVKDSAGYLRAVRRVAV
jgi:hypothetical protein